MNPWVRGDGVGYYAYLRSPLIDHDLRFENDYLAGNESFVHVPCGCRRAALFPRNLHEDGYVENHFTVGPAILWAPAVIAVHRGGSAGDHFGGIFRRRALASLFAVDGAERRPVMASCRCFWPSRSPGNISSSIGPFWRRWDCGWRVPCRFICISIPRGRTLCPHLPSPCFSGIGTARNCRRTTGQWALLGVMAGLMGNVYYPNCHPV